ncbi:MAG: hypothetical protein Q7R76_01145 [Candidatus Woesearchaeota archaeon]|nr:hypothetical protein [Candidatus Woesearchaeota archaeon]
MKQTRSPQNWEEFEPAAIPSQRLLPHQKLSVTLVVILLMLFSLVTIQKLESRMGDQMFVGFVARQSAAPQIQVTQQDLMNEYTFLHDNQAPRNGVFVRYGSRTYSYRDGKWNIPEPAASAPPPAAQARAVAAPAKKPSAPSASAIPSPTPQQNLVPLQYGISPATGEPILYHVDTEGNFYTYDKQRISPEFERVLRTTLGTSAQYLVAVQQARGTSSGTAGNAPVASAAPASVATSPSSAVQPAPSAGSPAVTKTVRMQGLGFLVDAQGNVYYPDGTKMNEEGKRTLIMRPEYASALARARAAPSSTAVAAQPALLPSVQEFPPVGKDHFCLEYTLAGDACTAEYRKYFDNPSKYAPSESAAAAAPAHPPSMAPETPQKQAQRLAEEFASFWLPDCHAGDPRQDLNCQKGSVVGLREQCASAECKTAFARFLGQSNPELVTFAQEATAAPSQSVPAVPVVAAQAPQQQPRPAPLPTAPTPPPAAGPAVTGQGAIYMEQIGWTYISRDESGTPQLQTYDTQHNTWRPPQGLPSGTQREQIVQQLRVRDQGTSAAQDLSTAVNNCRNNNCVTHVVEQFSNTPCFQNPTCTTAFDETIKQSLNPNQQSSVYAAFVAQQPAPPAQQPAAREEISFEPDDSFASAPTPATSPPSAPAAQANPFIGVPADMLTQLLQNSALPAAQRAQIMEARAQIGGASVETTPALAGAPVGGALPAGSAGAQEREPAPPRPVALPTPAYTPPAGSRRLANSNFYVIPGGTIIDAASGQPAPDSVVSALSSVPEYAQQITTQQGLPAVASPPSAARFAVRPPNRVPPGAVPLQDSPYSIDYEGNVYDTDGKVITNDVVAGALRSNPIGQQALAQAQQQRPSINLPPGSAAGVPTEPSAEPQPPRPVTLPTPAPAVPSTPPLNDAQAATRATEISNYCRGQGIDTTTCLSQATTISDCRTNNNCVNALSRLLATSGPAPTPARSAPVPGAVAPVPSRGSPTAASTPPQSLSNADAGALAINLNTYCQQNGFSAAQCRTLAHDPTNQCSTNINCMRVVQELSNQLPAPSSGAPAAGSMPGATPAPVPVPAATERYLVGAGGFDSEEKAKTQCETDHGAGNCARQQTPGGTTSFVFGGTSPAPVPTPSTPPTPPPVAPPTPVPGPTPAPTPAAAAAEAKTLEQIFEPAVSKKGTSPGALKDFVQATYEGTLVCDKDGKCAIDVDQDTKLSATVSGNEIKLEDGTTFTKRADGGIEVRHGDVLTQFVAKDGTTSDLISMGVKEVKTDAAGNIQSVTFERPRSCKNGIILTVCSGGPAEAKYDPATKTFKLEDGTILTPSISGVVLVKNSDGSTSLMAPGPSGAPELLTTLGKETTVTEKDGVVTVLGADGKPLQTIDRTHTENLIITNLGTDGKAESSSHMGIDLNGKPARVFEEFDHEEKTSSIYCDGGVKCGFALGCDDAGVCKTTGRVVSRLGGACTIQSRAGCMVVDEKGNKVEIAEFCKTSGMSEKDCKEKIDSAGSPKLTFFDMVNLANEGVQMGNDIKNFCGLVSDKTKCDGIFGDWFGGEAFLKKLTKTDPVLAGLFTGDWEESMCWKYLDRSNAEQGQEGFLYDLDGQLKLWIAAEKAPMPVPIEEGGLHNQPGMYYRINGEISPGRLCQIDNPPPAENPTKNDIEKAFKNEFLIFTIWLRGPNGETIIDPQKDGNNDNNVFSPRCDSGGITMIGQQTIVRVLPTDYTEICIKFHNPSNLQSFVSDELDGGMFCNTIVQSSPEISSTTVPTGGTPADAQTSATAQLGQIPEIKN